MDKKQTEYINKLNNIFFIHKKVNYDKCIELMKKTQILLIFDTIVDSDEIQPFLPSKITDYLLTNKPIFAITSKKSPLYDIINLNHICVTYNTEKIKEAILKQLYNINRKINNNISQYDNDYVSKKIFGNEFDIIDLEEEK